MSIEIQDVSIRCMGCSHSYTLDQAMRSAWLMCEYCNFAICDSCYKNLETTEYCLSFICSQSKRKIKPVPLPVEKILIFAQENNREMSRRGLLYKLFYEEGEKIHTLPFFTTKDKDEEASLMHLDKPTQIQEEAWRNYRLVITKRRGGKFITWEKVL